MRILIPLALLFVIAAGGCYYYFAYPPELYRRATEHSLKQFEAAVATQDRAKVSAAFGELLADPAKVRLSLSFFSIVKHNNETTQDFDKAGFTGFVDNILYSLENYSHRASLGEFHLSPARDHADITFTAVEEGEGISYYAGTAVRMHFAADTSCSARVAFGPMRSAKLESADCKTLMHSLPKAGEESKLKNPEALREFLR